MSEQSIYFKLFGGFFYKSAADEPWVNVNEALPGVSGKKACLFLKYLVINHKSVMSASRLMEMFWPEGVSNDPENALQQMMYKVRSLLKKMFPEVKNPIVSRSRQCCWNPDLTVHLDLERFDELFSIAKGDGTRKTEVLLEAISLYETGVETGGEQDWLEAAHVYYHSIYLDMCRMVMQPLQINSKWIKIIEICDKVCELEPCADEFVAHMMQALIMLGNQQMAIKRYKSYCRMLRQEYDIAPSAEVEQMYAIALKSEFKDMDGQNLLKLLELQEISGAFFCSFNVFTHLVMMERRHIKRSNQQASLIVFNLDELEQDIYTDIHRLEQVLRSGLRGYDAVTRLNANAFIVLLSDATIEIAEMIAERIRRRFYTEFSQSTAKLTVQTVPLLPI